MTWEGFYMGCFAFGFVFAVLGFLGGVLEWPVGHFLQAFHLHVPHAPIQGAAPHAPGSSTPSPAHGHSAFNFATVMAFLAWFGGAGYLLSGGGHLPALLVFVAAFVSGLGGGAIVFVFLTRVLLRHERALEAIDFDMVGVLGRVTVPIREGGTGEIVYSQAGTRRSSGARSDLPGGIPRGVEVVVTRFERGIAFVRPWSELAEEEALAPSPPDAPSPSPKPQIH
ncbi:MAG TPA: NfeD family protein [Thermoanaerobaculia bacterium]|jgi:hypothetical protein